MPICLSRASLAKAARHSALYRYFSLKVARRSLQGVILADVRVVLVEHVPLAILSKSFTSAHN
jgi:hypothetical protein